MEIKIFNLFCDKYASIERTGFVMAKGTFVADVEKQIQKKQEKLVSLREQIEIITGEIEELEKKKKEARYQDLIAEFEKSGRSYEDVIAFLEAVPKIDNQLIKGKRRGRPKKTESVVMTTE